MTVQFRDSEGLISAIKEAGVRFGDPVVDCRMSEQTYAKIASPCFEWVFDCFLAIDESVPNGLISITPHII